MGHNGVDGSHGVRGREGIRGDVTRASGGQLVGINEESAVGIAGIERKHAVVDILLGAFGAIARSQESAGGVWSQASFQASGLSVVVVAVTVVLGDVLENHAPESFHVESTLDFDVVHLARAQVSLRSNPGKSLHNF